MQNVRKHKNYIYDKLYETTFNFTSPFFYNLSFSQSIDFETEKNIIKETLSQYLNTNANSIASYLKDEKGYKKVEFGLKMGIVMEEDSLTKEDLKKDLKRLDFYADSISNVLKAKKIRVQISDTLFAYKYISVNYNLQKEADWEQNYQNLLSDFEENALARFDTIIGKEYIDLIKKQVNYKGENKPFLTEELNHSYYQFEKTNHLCDDEFCIKASKLYRAVFNNDYTKGCYLVSFYCRENEICRSFIFIKKEKNRWIYVDEYPSWLIDES